jgi:polysaccharide deacetylase family protein (PEP-CTERM system associated)
LTEPREASSVTNVLSIDLEEYFHPSEVQPFVNTGDWDMLPSRIEQQTAQILDLLAQRHVLATFFIVGWVAEKKPALVRRIANAGHEIGSHSYAHRLVYTMTPDEFRTDTTRSVNAIADACGMPVTAFRAPSYSITNQSIWALEILAELGFTHDSSIYPISHDRYGIPGFNRHAHSIRTPAGPIYEVPIATVRCPNGHMAPVGGGAYLRLLPYRYMAAGIRAVNIGEQQPACVYFHPWEIDPDQPQLATSVIARMRTYSGIGSMLRKVDRLLTDFRFSTLSDVHPLLTSSARSIQAFA